MTRRRQLGETRTRFYSYRSDEGHLREGTWWVHADRMCIRWKTAGDGYCREVLKDWRGRYRKILFRPSGKEADVVVYSSFIPGKFEDLTRP